ncbi:hypothetical protein JCM10213_006961 [Rhodosporidiobolus nylandii]
MLIEQEQTEVMTATGPMTIYIVKPKIPGYPNAKFPGVVVYSEIYQVTGPVLRFAQQIASQGYICALPCSFHEWAGAAALDYGREGTDAGNSYKIQKLLGATDEDSKLAIDTLTAHKNCTGKIGSTGEQRFSLFQRQTSYLPFARWHDGTLSPDGDDTLLRGSKGEIMGELVLIFGTQDGHVPLEARTKIRAKLTDPSVQPPLRLTFLELQANHAFIRDEMSKGRFDAAITKVCFDLLLETFGRTLRSDLGEPVEEKKDGKLVC